MLSRKPMRQILLLLFAATLALTSCNVGAAPSPTPDINALNTAIVGTTVAQLSAQFTQTAVAAPTNTSMPTNTAAELSTAALPTLDSSAPSPTVDVAALPTFSFLNTPVTGANTPIAGFTQVAPPTAPASGATASLNDSCNSLTFEGDVTIPDGTILDPGVNFKKVWAVRNTGTCTWDEGYSLVYIGGTTPDLDPYTFDFKKSGDFVAPGEGINLGINLTTPCKPGKYNGTWRMRNDKGYYFGSYLSVYVEVTKKC